MRGLAALEPDLVINTGDNLAHLEAVPAVLAAHGRLLDRPGAFVLGSNDYFAPRPKNPARYLLPAGGPRRVVGTRLPTARSRRGLPRRRLAGSDQPPRRARGGRSAAGPGRGRRPAPGPRPLPGRGPADRRRPVRIGVTHAPYRRVLDAMADDGCGAGARRAHPRRPALCAVRAWRVGDQLRPAPPSGQGRLPAGASAWLHVSAGLGTSPYAPVRFACRPEATLLTLVPRDRPDLLAR